MASTQYITVDKDRWDTIELKAYGTSGNVDRLRDLQNANPYIQNTDVFKSGIKIVVPIFEEQDVTIISLLPPWKRTKPSSNASQIAADYNSGGSTDSSGFDNSFG